MPRLSSGTAKGQYELSFSCDALEPRLVFSAPYDFAAVGIRFDDGPSVFLAEGVVAADDSITGTMQFADAGGSGAAVPIDWTSLVRGDGGSFTFGTRNGFTAYGSQIGTQFIFEDRWSLGSFVGRDAQGAARDMAFIMDPDDGERPLSFATIIKMTRVMPDDTLQTFDLAIMPTGTPGTYSFTYRLPGGEQTVQRNVTSYEDGRAVFDSGEIVFFAEEGDAQQGSTLFIDMNNADGIVGMGVGREFGESRLAGRFRGTVMVDGPIGAAFFGIDPAEVEDGPVVANVVVQLDFWTEAIVGGTGLPNSFTIYRQDEFDVGMRNPIGQGSWNMRFEQIFAPPFISVEVIDLFGADDVRVTIGTTFQRAFTFDRVTQGGVTEQLQGAASAIDVRPGLAQEVVVDVDADGHPIVYMEYGSNTDDLQIYSVDLVDEVGGEAVVGPVMTWIIAPLSSASTPRYVAGLSATGDVLLWRVLADDVSWSFVNLTQSLDGARPIVSELFNTGEITSNIVSLSGGIPASTFFQTLAGFDADGNFVAYKLGFTGFRYTMTFEFIDVEEGIEGGPVPDVVGGYSGWNTGWGGVNFAGVDANGEIWVVWWTPSLENWQVNNLSEEADTPQLVAARPSTVRTAWDSFHIFATDTQGHVIATWWAVGQSQWESVDLTAQFSGPTFEDGSLTASFTYGLQNLNVVGRDADGQARIYWWNAEFGWQINSISGGVAPSDIPETPWTMTWAALLSAPSEELAYTQSLLGKNDDGDLVRLIWKSYTADAWILENLTELSTPFLV